MTRLLGLTLVLWLAACMAGPTEDAANQPYFAPGHLLALPEPADLGRPAEWLQHITVRHGDETFAFDGRISITADRFHLVGVDGLGRRAMSITWEKSGRITAMRADWLPPEVRPGPMLADIILIYWPPEILRQALASSGATLHDTEESRSISAEGSEILAIDYLGDGRVKYRNMAWGYEIEVQSVEVAP
jgi:hypothetical protein